MGAAASVEGGGSPSAMVTAEEAHEIMRIIFSRPVSHEQLRSFLDTTSRDMVDEATVQAIMGVLAQGSALQSPVSGGGGGAAEAATSPGVAAAPAPAAVGDLAMAVRNAFYGQFDSVRQAFAAADKDGGGTISHAEFASCVRKGGLNISDEQVLAAAAAIDTNHDGRINYREFLTFLTNEVQPSDASSHAAAHIATQLRVQITERFTSMREAFLTLDPDRSGCIDTAEVLTLLRGQNFNYSEEDINLFVASYPHTKDGGFSYAEFCKMVEGAQPFVNLQ